MGLNYLEDIFDTSHTQGKEYIMCEIDSYINTVGELKFLKSEEIQ
ncbi:MAG: DUF3791 domain-containing protein [Tannerella sp.]|nr:DUF3791 domain-containing protein [Tannerella sp.]